MRAKTRAWSILFALLVALGGPGSGLAAESGALDRAAVQAAHKQGNYAEVLRLVSPHAQQGDAYAQYVLGLLYDNGQGVAQDHAQSLQWYLKAAQQGYAAAQFSAGLQYDRGRGTKEDPVQAFRWYREAAERGNLNAQVNLGVAYSRGRGVAADRNQALLWWRRAADAGQLVAQGNLGAHIGSQVRTPDDLLDAYLYVSLAAAKGDPEAIDNRKKLVATMTKAQLEEGDRRVAAWKPARPWRLAASAPAAGDRRAEAPPSVAIAPPPVTGRTIKVPMSGPDRYLGLTYGFSGVTIDKDVLLKSSSDMHQEREVSGYIDKGGPVVFSGNLYLLGGLDTVSYLIEGEYTPSPGAPWKKFGIPIVKSAGSGRGGDVRPIEVPFSYTFDAGVAYVKFRVFMYHFRAQIEVKGWFDTRAAGASPSRSPAVAPAAGRPAPPDENAPPPPKEARMTADQILSIITQDFVQ